MALAFVTGATGFLGSSLLPELQDRGFQLRCLVRRGSNEANLTEIPYERVEGDITDEGIIRDALDGVDVVVHMAALLSFCKRDTERLWQVNSRGTQILARAARQAGVERFLHVSSATALGAGRRPRILDEQRIYNLQGHRIPYFESKRAAEQAVLSQVQSGLDAVIVNPTSLIGPGDRRGFRPCLWQSIAATEGRYDPPGGASVADVRDVAAGCTSALHHGQTGERYILGGENLPSQELLNMMRTTDGRPASTIRPMQKPFWRCLAMGARLREVIAPMNPPITAQTLRLAGLHFWYSSNRAAADLGYEFRPAAEAVQAAQAWYRTHHEPAIPVSAAMASGSVSPSSGA